jgi:hypothetical protein
VILGGCQLLVCLIPDWTDLAVIHRIDELVKALTTNGVR